MTIHYDGFGAPVTTSIHEVESRFWRGSYGDRPEPWQRTYECVCGADLGMDEEGGFFANVQEAFEEHLKSLSDRPEIDGDTIE